MTPGPRSVGMATRRPSVVLACNHAYSANRSSYWFAWNGSAERSVRPPSATNLAMKSTSTATTSAAPEPVASWVTSALWWSPCSRMRTSTSTPCSSSNAPITASTCESRSGYRAIVRSCAWVMDTPANRMSSARNLFMRHLIQDIPRRGRESAAWPVALRPDRSHGIANYQFRLELSVHLPPPAREDVECNSGSCAAHLGEGLADRGEGGVEVTGEEHVVVPHHAELLGNAKPGFSQALQSASGHLVVSAEQRTEIVFTVEQTPNRLIAALLQEVGFDDERLVVLEPGCLQRLPVAVQARTGVGKGQRTGDVGDLRVSLVDQVASRQFSACLVVEVDATIGNVGEVTANEHDRHGPPHQLQELHVRGRFEVDDEGVGTPFEEVLDGLAFTAVVRLAAGHDHVHAALLELGLDPLQQRPVVGAAQVVHANANAPGAVGDEAAGERVRRVV